MLTILMSAGIFNLFGTDITLIWLITYIDEEVYLHTARHNKLFGTHISFVSLLCTMDERNTYHMPCIYMVFFPRMNSNV